MLGRKKKKKGGGKGEELPSLEFKPRISDPQQQQGALIACRSIEQYPDAVLLVAQAIKARADQMLLDYSQQGVAVRFRVDGLWESMPPMERPTGDGVLVVFKRLCELNPSDRKSRQQGSLPVRYKGDWILDIVSQGVASGERVLVRIESKKPALSQLSELGMREKMQTQLRALLNSDDAMFIFSATQGHGLPTTWRVGLDAADRYVRDFHSVEDVKVGDPEQINITKHTFDAAAGETPMTVLKSLLLKQPDVLIFPDLVNLDVVNLICEEVVEEHRYAITRVIANSAVEALLKTMMTYKSAAKQIAKITCGVLNQRLVRRLCTECRQPFQPSPQLLQKLGIPPGRVRQLYQPTIPPPPEQRVDANGKPIEIDICSKCDGRGYFGRVAIFELLELNNAIRQAALKTPSVEQVVKIARQHGFLTLQEEGVLAVATGLTSLQELQRVLSPKKKA